MESCWAHKLEVHRLKLNYILLISFFGGAPALLQSKMTEMHKKKNIIHDILFSYLILFMPSHFYHSLPSRHSIFCHHHLLVTSSSSLKIFLLLFEKNFPLYSHHTIYTPHHCYLCTTPPLPNASPMPSISITLNVSLFISLTLFPLPFLSFPTEMSKYHHSSMTLSFIFLLYSSIWLKVTSLCSTSPSWAVFFSQVTWWLD